MIPRGLPWRLALVLSCVAGHALAVARADEQRSFRIEKRYLNLPVGSGAAVRKVNVLVDGRAERTFDIRLADASPEWWAFLDVGPWQGKTVTLQVDKLPEDSTALAAIEPS